MSFFGKLFSSKKEEPKTTSEAIQKLRETENMLNKKQDFLETKIQQEIALAKKHGTKNKRAAIQALKRKKRYEKQLQQIDGTLSTIEMQREALENANTNSAVLKAMQDASEAMKTANRNMNVDDVHDMMDDIAEQNDVAKEISDVISNPVSWGEADDEDELEQELELLEQEDIDDKLSKADKTNVPLPEIPTAEIGERKDKVKQKKVKDDTEDRELKELMTFAE